MATKTRHDELPLGRWQLAALIIGLAGVALCLLGVWWDVARLMQAYLFVFIYWWLVSVGCLGLAIIHQMTDGAWGRAAKPFLDAGILTLPLVAAAFLPLALGLKHTYPWADPDFFEGASHAENRQWYLSPWFFIGRGVLYFAIILTFGFLLTAGGGAAALPKRKPQLSALAAVLLVLVVSFAAMDWGMSLDPDWYSTIYGGLFIADGLLTAMCLTAAGAALVCWKFKRRSEFAQTILHDLGKLLLAFLMVWAYLEFSQYLIIYSGNLPAEAVWYTRRLNDGWEWLALTLVVLHFAVPFFFLLSQDLKREPRALAWVAIALAIVHVVDVYWTIMPSSTGEALSVHWTDFAALAAVGGLWMCVFLRQLNYRLSPMLEHWPHVETR